MRLLTIALVLFSTFLNGQDAREIINHYLDTVSNGDISNWNIIKSIYTESQVYYSQNDFDEKINLLKPDKSSFHKSFSILPYNSKIEMYDDSSFTKPTSTFYYFKDKTIIQIGNVPQIIKQPPTRDEFFSVHLPVRIAKLMDKCKSIELLGMKEFPLDGLLCYEIKMTTKGQTYVLYINRDTFLLEYWNGRPDGDLSVLAKLYNYRKVNDFLIPMSDSLIKNGVIYFSNNTKKYLINLDIDIEIFKYKGN